MAKKSKNGGKILIPKVAVIGVGRVGLPLSLFLADHNQEVFGIDIDKQKITLITKGQMPFLEEGAEPLLNYLKIRAIYFDEKTQQDALIFAEQVYFQFDYDPWHKVTPEVQKAADRLIEDLGFSKPPS